MAILDANYKRKKLIQFKKSLLLGFVFFLIFAGSTLSFVVYKQTQTDKEDDSKKSENKQNNDQTISFTIEADVPDNISAKVIEYTEKDTSLKYEINKSNKSDISLLRNPKSTHNAKRIWTKHFLLVTQQTNLVENLSSDEMDSFIEKQKIGDTQLIWSTDVDDFIRSKYNPGVGYPTYTREQINELLNTSEVVLAIIPFEELKPNMRVIPINNQSPLDDEYNKLTYILTDTYWIQTEDTKLFEKFKTPVLEILGSENFDSTKLKRMIITGHSAIGAGSLQNKDSSNTEKILPVKSISYLLSKADLTIVNNTAPIFEGCVQDRTSIQLCGDLSAIDTLNEIGADVVDVSGNRILDYGYSKFTSSLQLYSSKGIKYFGGGKDNAEAHTPAVIEVEGTRIAFLGYSFLPPKEYIATYNKPGNAEIDLNVLKRDIEKAKQVADYIFVDMQWGGDTQYETVDYQKEYGKAAIENGAVVVTGVSTHWIQGIESYKSGIIFYGLGNFISDQIQTEESRSSFIVQHYFYDKKYLGYQLIPIKISENYQIEVAEQPQKDIILKTVFTYSSFNSN